MKHNLFLASLVATPWAMHPDVMRVYATLLAGSFASRLPGADIDLPEALAPRQAARPTAGNNIAVMGLYGPIMQRAGLMDMCTGGTSTQGFTQSLRAAMADDSVSQILVDIDSPGGSVAGVAELAAELRTARNTKPIVAVANSMAASAAYWLGSSCSELYCTPGGQVGSIGVITAHDDISKAMEEAGIKTTLITAGKFKAEGNPYGPMDEDALRNTQSMIDSYYADFTGDVSKGRKVGIDAVRDDMGQGRMLRGVDAQKAGMVDGVKTIDEVIRGMQRNARSSSRSALAASRRELEILG